MKTITVIAAVMATSVQVAMAQPVDESSGAPIVDLGKTPELCDTLESPPESNRIILAASAQFWRMYVTKREGIDYWLGVDSSGRVRFMQTEGSAFVTPENVSAGRTREQLEAEFGNEVIHEPGFAYFIALPSGWNAAFPLPGDPEYPNKGWAEPGGEHVVTWFFRRASCRDDAG